MKAEPGRVPELLLEQYALGELYGAEKARLESALESDPALRERLEALGRSSAEILAEAPPAEIAAAIRRRMLVSAPGGVARPSRSGRPRPFLGIAFPAAAAALVLASAFAAKGILLPPRGELVLAKGGAPALQAFRKAASGPEELAEGRTVAAGDLVQLKYSAGTASYGAIASIDGRGKVTWILPADYRASARSPRLEGAGAMLGSAYELDDAPRFERFFLVSSKGEFELAPVARALGALAASGNAESGPLALTAGLEYKSLLLRKGGGSP
jgi:hypothetical protein